MTSRALSDGACILLVMLAVFEPASAEQAAAARAGNASSPPTATAYPPKEWGTSFWPAKGWQWANLDPAKTAPNNHRILWENDQVRLVEVTIRPGETENLHADPLPSVIAFDAPLPADDAISTAKQGKRTGHGLKESWAALGTAPPGKQFPACATAVPQAPYRVTNGGDFPLHFYRVEFKRIEGYALQQHWKEWHPWLLAPVKPVTDLAPGSQLGAPYSSDWPYPMAYDSIAASPNNHFLRFEDTHVRFLEVSTGAGRAENMHGHPYPSVFAVDNEIPPATMAAVLAADKEISARTGKPPIGDRQLDPNDPLNRQAGTPAFAPEKVMLQCVAEGPQAPHAIQNIDPGAHVMGHFYRLEFKRIDGDAIKTRWREWYGETIQEGAP